MKAPLVLFDANGPVGYGAKGQGDFATCRDLLAHMDRLGIARALAWSIQARDHHPATGNSSPSLTPFAKERNGSFLRLSLRHPCYTSAAPWRNWSGF